MVRGGWGTDTARLPFTPHGKKQENRSLFWLVIFMLQHQAGDGVDAADTDSQLHMLRGESNVNEATEKIKTILSGSFQSLELLYPVS